MGSLGSALCPLGQWRGRDLFGFMHYPYAGFSRHRTGASASRYSSWLFEPQAPQSWGGYLGATFFMSVRDHSGRVTSGVLPQALFLRCVKRRPSALSSAIRPADVNQRAHSRERSAGFDAGYRSRMRRIDARIPGIEATPVVHGTICCRCPTPLARRLVRTQTRDSIARYLRPLPVRSR